MLARIASLAVTLAVLTACGREPQETPRTSPATGETRQSADQAGAGDRTRSQDTRTPGTSTAGQPAEGGQHYEAGAASVHDQSEGMSEEERAAALRACERLEAAQRERCVNEVREQSNPDAMRRERLE